MQKIILLFTIIALISSGCASRMEKIVALKNGITKDEVIELWGAPADKANVGVTENKYPVEVWQYHQKTSSIFPKDKKFILIFVDGELYSWAEDDPDFAFSELTKLGVLKSELTELSLEQYYQSLRNSANQAIQTQKTMDIIKTYQNHQNTQMNIQTQKYIRMQQQQQLFRAPPPRPRIFKPKKQ